MWLRMFQRTLLDSSFLAILLVASLSGQGVQPREYTGLDKYIGQGRPESSSMVGTRAAEFLAIPVGARAIALGSAFTAVADDISAMWWNPAGLGFIENTQFMFNHADYTLDFSYSYIAGATPVADGRIVLGGFIGYMNYPQMEITTVRSPNGTGSYFSAYDTQIGGSVAMHFSDRFIAGLNVKYVHQDVYNNLGASAFAIDAGGIYHAELLDREIKFAFSIQNLGTNMTMQGPNLYFDAGPETPGGNVPDGYGDYSDDPTAISRRHTRKAQYLTHTYRLPTSVKVALSYNLYTAEKINWLAAGELWRNSGIPISYSFGSEVSYSFTPHTTAAIRSGWKVQTDEFNDSLDDFGYAYLGDDPTWRGLSFGGGVKRDFGSRFIEFSYAYRNKGRLTADNFFTVSFGF